MIVSPLWRRTAALLALLSFISWTDRGATQTSRGFDLSWNSTPNCPGRMEFLKRVDAMLPNDTHAARDLSVRVTVTDSMGKYQLRLALNDGEREEERSYEGGTCEEVTGAAAVAVALMMQPPGLNTSGRAPTQGAGPSKASTDAGGQEGGVGRQGASAAGASPERRRVRTAGAVSSGSRSRVSLSGGHAQPPVFVLALPAASATFLLFPQASWGLRAGIGAEYFRWRFVLYAAWHPSVRVASDTFIDSAARVARVRAAFSGCRWWGSQRWEWAPCVGVSLQHLRVRGEGAQVLSRRATANWLAAGPGVAGRLHLTSMVALFAGIDVHLQTSRPRLSIEGQGLLQQVGLLDLTTQVAAEWFF